MRREAKNATIVNPSPFFKVSFQCSNRAFYDVLNDVIDIIDPLMDKDRENAEDYVCQKRDYDGDLEELVISDPECVKAILTAYGLDYTTEYDLHLSCF